MNRLFVGMKISTKLQMELDKCAPDAERYYYKDNNSKSLQIVVLGEDRVIGKFLQDGYPIAEINGVIKNLRSIITLITRGFRIEEDSIRIYAGSEAQILP